MRNGRPAAKRTEQLRQTQNTWHSGYTHTSQSTLKVMRRDDQARARVGESRRRRYVAPRGHCNILSTARRGTPSEVKLAMRPTYARPPPACTLAYAVFPSFPCLAKISRISTNYSHCLFNESKRNVINPFLLITHLSQCLSSILLPPPSPRLRAKSCPPTPPPAPSLPPFPHPPGPTLRIPPPHPKPAQVRREN